METPPTDLTSATDVATLLRAQPDLARLLTPKLTRYIPHTPFVQQQAFLLLDCLEAFYGGAAGGGKSDALLMAALQYVDIPGYAALLLRRTYADLMKKEAILDRAHEWLGPWVRRREIKWRAREWRFEWSNGATLSFGYLAHDKHLTQYQSAAFQFVGFDELTHFPEKHYRYLFSRMRKLKGLNVPMRMRSASNPGNIGHEWVKQRFLVEGKRRGRVFIPSKMTDNPHLDQTEYQEALAQLDPVTRAQLEHGDWDIRESGGMFKRAWFEVLEAVPVGCRWVRYWDLASTDPKDVGPTGNPDWTVGALLGFKDGVYFLRDIVRLRGGPYEVEEAILQTARRDGKAVHIWMEREGGATGKMTIAHFKKNVLRGFTFRGMPVSGSKINRANPVSADAQAGLIKLIRGEWIGPFLDEADAFPKSPHDDQIDALSGAHEALNMKGVVEPLDPQLARLIQNARA